MFRKQRRQDSVTAELEPRRFSLFRARSRISRSPSTADGAVFAVGVADGQDASGKETKRSLFARVFSPSKPKTEGSLEEGGRSLWQRSKSIFRPRKPSGVPIVKRSDSTVIELQTITGPGSLQTAGPVAVDTDGLLQRIFEANREPYVLMREHQRLLANPHYQCRYDEVFVEERVSMVAVQESDVIAVQESDVVAVQESNVVGIHEMSTATTVTQLSPESVHLASPILTEIAQTEQKSPASSLLPLAQCPILETDDGRVQDYLLGGDNPQLDSPLLSDAPTLLSGEEGSEHSLDEIAEMFGLLAVCPPAATSDGSLRYLVERSNGSEESIRFYNCFSPAAGDSQVAPVACIPRSAQSLDKLPTMTEKRILARRSLSGLKTATGDFQVVDRRRSLGARVSQIVAFFEGTMP